MTDEPTDFLMWTYSADGQMRYRGFEPPLVLVGNGPRWAEVIYIRVVMKRG